jgi:hypothetical protein
MTMLSKDEIAAIAEVAAAATISTMEAARRRADERLYGVEAIAAECGVHDDTLRMWVNKHGFPLDKDPRGYSVRRWMMDRWFEARRVAIDHLKKHRSK